VGDRILCQKLNSAGLEKVDVKVYTPCGLLGVGLLITNFVMFNMSAYRYLLVHTSIEQVHMSIYWYVWVNHHDIQ
jgi:hypothetical protein